MMAQEKLQYDKNLGGKHGLPKDVCLSEFVVARSQEIQVMKSNLSNSSSAKLAFQSLPKHMRRRAMSHNVKRLPVKIRQIHASQMQKSGIPLASKRPSNLFKCRPRNVCAEYINIANRKFKWMETHLWHAKRFHMTSKWGFKIPFSPCDKAFRACYRAAAQNTLIQDISYVRPIEITAPRQCILFNFKKITNLFPGNLSINGKTYLKGNREGQITIYTPNQNGVKNPIGDVTFHWRPNSSESDATLWIWVHSAFYSSVLDSLIHAFNVEKSSPETYKSSVATIKEIGGQLARFRLVGPLSNCTLQETLTLLDEENFSELDNIPRWLESYYKCNIEDLIQIKKSWTSMEGVEDISVISPHIILFLMVKDPRYNTPKKRVKSSSDIKITLTDTLNDSNICKSPLWDSTIRNSINESIISDGDIAKKRRDLVVPGSELTEGATFIPIMLIQRPGCTTNDNLGFGSGWDLIMPSAYAKSFWLAIIMRGARAGGLREMDSIHFEMCQSYYLYPDTEAGKSEEESITKELREKYFKKPPDKRENYQKLNISCPFSWNWELLISEWSHKYKLNSPFYVIREKFLLHDINEFLQNRRKNVPFIDDCSLIPVKITACQRGLIKPFAILCKCEKEPTDPVEPLGKDLRSVERKALQKQHAIMLKKFKKTRSEEKDNISLCAKLAKKRQEEIDSFKERMNELWLPEPTTLKNSCSRQVVGLVRTGGYSFISGQSVGLGYITSGALGALASNSNRKLIYFRNVDSRQYRLGVINVIF